MDSSTLYRFAHEIFPHHFFHQGELFFHEISLGQEYFLDYVKEIWDMAREGEKEVPPDFHFTVVDLAEKSLFCLLEMPQPKMHGEPIYLGLVYGPGTASRYFLYEVGYSPFQGELEDMDGLSLNTLFLCERTPAGLHRNYGSFQDSRRSFFLEQVQEILRG